MQHISTFLMKPSLSTTPKKDSLQHNDYCAWKLPFVPVDFSTWTVNLKFNRIDGHLLGVNIIEISDYCSNSEVAEDMIQ
jgi:hypothetical protein